MPEGTVEKPVAPEASKGIAAIRHHWAFKLALAIAAVVPAIVANYHATHAAKEEVGTAKDKTELVYQPTKHAVRELQAWTKTYQEKIAKLEAEVVTLKRQARNQQLDANKRRKAEAEARAIAAAVRAAIPAPPSIPLPDDLDKALEQQRQQQAKEHAAQPPPAPR